MARADGSIVIEINADDSSAIKGINNTKKAADGLASTLKKVGSLLGGVFAVKAIVDFGKKAVELGSNVAEVQNVVDVAFGDMAYKVEAFADSAITNFGMSQLAAKKTASTYMAMAKNMGLTMEQASDMSITLAGLTGDVASFYNISQELADTKLKSVFTGETETLKDLGIVMTEANLQAYALSRGLSGNIQAMSQAEKVALRYNFVVDQLAQASGDFIRTQDGWANQTRILSMQWQELMSVIGQALIQVLLPVLRVLNQIIGALISMANAAAAAFSTLFGTADKQIEQTGANAAAVGSSIEGSVENQDDLTAAVKKTNKEQKKSVASFDEINKLATETAGAAGAAAAGGTGNMLEIPGLDMSGLETTFNVKGNIDTGLQTFFSEFAAAVQPSIDAVGRFNEQLNIVGAFGGEALRGFYDGVLVPIGTWTLGEGFPRFVDAITNGLASVNWSKINESLEMLWGSVTPFAVTIGEGLLWFWENVLVPLGAWTMNEAVPAFLEALSAGVDLCNTVFEIFRPYAVWLWDNFLQPIAQWTGGVIVDVLRWLAGALTDVSNWMKEHEQTVRNIAIVVGSFAAAWVLVNGAIQTWNTIAAVAQGVTTAFGAATSLLTSPVSLVTAGIGALIAIIVLLIENWDTVKATAILVWDAIKGVWEKASSWFKENVLDPIVNGFKNFVNKGIIGAFESMVNIVIRGVNWLIGALNRISFAVPEWVPGIGGKRFGFNIAKLTEIELPRLATGAVVPPNREFMAVLGDNKAETEVVSPLSTMKQAFLEALRESGSGGGQTVILELDGREFGRAVFKANQTESRRIGTQLVGV